jgi:hypothetical protein
MVLKGQFRNTMLKLTERSRSFCILWKIIPQHWRTIFKASLQKIIVFGFGSARSVSWFRKLWPLLISLSLKHGEQFSLRTLYIRILFNLAYLTCRLSHPKPSKKSLDLILSYLAPVITLAPWFCSIFNLSFNILSHVSHRGEQ